MNPYYPNLLSPLRVGNVILKNRMITPPSAPHNVTAGENFPSDGLIETYSQRARGGAAIVTCDGNSFGTMKGFLGWDASDPDAKNYMAQLADSIHFYGARAHGVIMMMTDFTLDSSENVPQIRMMPGSRATEGSDKKEIPTEMLYELIEQYSDLARHMADCGFDGTYIHMSYRMVLPGRMLSPITNRRTDEFGGSFENRIRFPMLLCKRIKEKCGRDFLIEVSISGHDIEPDGWQLDDTVAFAKATEGLIDIMTIRSGELDNQHPTGFAKSRTPFLYMAEYMKKAGVKQAIAASAGFTEPDDCEAAIREGKADLISMARAYVSNPNFGRLLYEGRADDIVPCLRCNKCHVGNHYLTVCVVNPRFGCDKTLDRRIVPVEREKKVAIIGGGPAGMKAALTAADRGHKVTIFEKAAQLGGLINHSRYASFKWPMKNLLEFFERKCAENPNITVNLSCDPDPDWLEAQDFDAVIAAVGSQPIIPRIPGIEKAGSAVDSFAHVDSVKDRVVIIGGGEIGVEAGLHLAQNGRDVTVIEMKEHYAEEAMRMHYYNMLVDAVEEYEDKLHIIVKATCTGVGDGFVTYRDESDVEHTVPSDTVLLAVGIRPDVAAAEKFMKCGKQFFTIGDCNPGGDFGQIGSLQTAIRAGFDIASTI
ncbi:MAG: FAD-dependent oxidoreductase [Eubacteriaceae bacterium]|nr:FAD-dependent oxidoreductase [Eubacteriaceae bacterium]